jgi:uncharacterized phage protein gp47/JayE
MVNIPDNANQVFNRMNTDYKASIPEADNSIRNSFNRALLKGYSFAVYLLYKTLEKAINVVFWDTTTGIYLERAAGIFGVTRNPATASSGNVVFTGTDGTSIPSGTQISSEQGGLYETQSAATVSETTISVDTMTYSAGTVTVNTVNAHNYASGIDVTISGATETDYNGTHTITVVDEDSFTFDLDATPSSPATGTIESTATYTNVKIESIEFGADQNLDAGSELSLSTPIFGVDDEAYADYDGITGGSDIESDDSFRDRFLFRVRNPIALFNANAIENQARTISYVGRVWVQGTDDRTESFTVSSLTFASNGATLQTASDHGLLDGQDIEVSGANEAGYNGVFKALVIDDDELLYVPTGSPSSPATGSISMEASITNPGQVRVFFLKTDGTAPSAGEVTTVKDAILEIKPVTTANSDVLVQAPTFETTNFTFTSITPDNSAMRTAIENELDDFFSNEAEVGVDVSLDKIKGVISGTISSTGESLESFTLSAPASDLEVNASELLTLGTVSF